MFKRFKQGAPAFAATALFNVCSVGIALATPPAQPYLADDATQLLYHFDEIAGSTVARDFSGHVPVRDAGYGAASAGQGNAQAYFGRTLKAGQGNTNRASWTDSGAGTASFLYTSINTGFTIEGWFRTPANFSVPTYPTALITVQPSGNAQPDYQLMILPSSDPRGALNLVFGDTRFLVSSGALNSGPNAWQSSTWYHIAVVVKPNGDGTFKYSLYRSKAGDAAATLLASRDDTAIQPVVSSVDRVISIGNFYGFSGNAYFPGEIDEFRFSAGARSADDLRLTIAPTVPDRIRVEALGRNDPFDQPLPLMGSWSDGWYGYTEGYINNHVAANDRKEHGYSPAWQVDRIVAGHHLLPWLEIPDWNFDFGNSTLAASAQLYYQGPLAQFDAWDVPISFVGTQWERVLYDESQWSSLTGASSPNAINSDGSVNTVLSPFGAQGAWEEAGELWGGSAMMGNVQGWYPEPPKVFFFSNNEPRAVEWSSVSARAWCGVAHNASCIADTDYHPDKPSGFNDLNNAQKRQVIGDHWKDRYRALQGAFRGELSTPWQDHSAFIGYKAFGPSIYGRWVDWGAYALGYDTDTTVTPPMLKRIDPSPLTWDGGSASNYLNLNLSPPTTDFNVKSRQVEAMNWVFMRKEALEVNSDFWFELSMWNDCDIHDNGNRCGFFAGLSTPQTYTPARYAGMAQFSMWLLQPRAVRDYRGRLRLKSDSVAYYEALEAAVDAVYADPVLQSFWRSSELVANTDFAHPYQAATFSAYAAEARNFLLTTAANPSPSGWTLTTQLNVYALARVQGATPNRQWLVYVHAPNADTVSQNGVSVKIPGYSYNSGLVTVDATVGGSFYLVKESDNNVEEL